MKLVGPGIITGAADDDPSGIATYSQTGAQFGYGQLWTVLFILPFLTAVQEACARIGAVTGKGIAAVVRQHYSKKVLYFVVGLVLVANTINIGADIGAMAAAAQLVVPVNFAFLTIGFTVLILLLEIFTSYKVYSRILKWLALALIAYLLSLIMIQVPWSTVLKATFIPHMEFNPAFLFIITGVFGTTISPYMFFWEASEEVEEERENHVKKIDGRPLLTKKYIKNLRIDNFMGMFFSQITTWSIIVVAGTVFFNNHITTISTAAEAAKALEPLVSGFPNAGVWAKIVFASGIIGLGMLAVPVLSGSAAYSIAEAFNWKEGLNQKFKKAHGFYGVITIAMLIGLLINFVGISPINALIYAAVLNGVASIPLLFLIGKIAADKAIMGKEASGVWSKILVSATFGFTLLTGLALIYSVVFK